MTHTGFVDGELFGCTGAVTVAVMRVRVYSCAGVVGILGKSLRDNAILDQVRTRTLDTQHDRLSPVFLTPFVRVLWRAGTKELDGVEAVEPKELDGPVLPTVSARARAFPRKITNMEPSGRAAPQLHTKSSSTEHSIFTRTGPMFICSRLRMYSGSIYWDNDGINFAHCLQDCWATVTTRNSQINYGVNFELLRTQCFYEKSLKKDLTIIVRQTVFNLLKLHVHLSLSVDEIS
jgi:hypothetical protein